MVLTQIVCGTCLPHLHANVTRLQPGYMWGCVKTIGDRNHKKQPQMSKFRPPLFRDVHMFFFLDVARPPLGMEHVVAKCSLKPPSLSEVH